MQYICKPLVIRLRPDNSPKKEREENGIMLIGISVLAAAPVSWRYVSMFHAL